jgi:arsenite methyltransferase
LTDAHRAEQFETMRVMRGRRHRGTYGCDAPYGLAIFAVMAIGSGIVATLAWQRGETRTALMMAVYSAFFLCNAASFIYTTRRGKFIEWDRILARLELRGDEAVLDMGCGRGAVLTAVARRLTTGQATGIDLWSTKDQSGNARDVTLRNASLEEVAHRVQVDTGDMRALPYADASFDLVVSSLAIHNIPSRADRRRAVAEGFRVLRPGGRIVIADIRSTAIYVDELRSQGATSVTRHRLGWRFWWGNPIACTRLVTASKALS